MEEMIDIVDEEDRFIRKATRKEVREKALLHRYSRIIIVNNERNLLVQKRSVHKEVYPGYWDLGVAETVLSGESYESAAIRGLDEELGIVYVSNIQLIRSFLFKLKFRSAKDNGNCKVYKHMYNGKITPQPKEVEEAMFLSIEEIEKLIAGNKFTPSGKLAFETHLKRLNRGGQK